MTKTTIQLINSDANGVFGNRQKATLKTETRNYRSSGSNSTNQTADEIVMAKWLKDTLTQAELRTAYERGCNGVYHDIIWKRDKRLYGWVWLY